MLKKCIACYFDYDEIMNTERQRERKRGKNAHTFSNSNNNKNHEQSDIRDGRE